MTNIDIHKIIESLVSSDYDDGNHPVVGEAITKLRSLRDRNNHLHAQVSWQAGDVIDKAKDLDIELTKEQAEDWLHDNQGQIQDDMTQRGWDSIETMLRMDFTVGE
jgi:hypothetical protein